MKKLVYGFVALLYCLSLLSCSRIAVEMTPRKQPLVSHSELAKHAEQQFWQVLHQGAYQNIAVTEKLLTAAYLQNPNDPKLAAHLGFLHIWRIAERQRSSNSDPDIVNQIVLANKYFSDAVELDPNDARYLGFLGAAKLIEGSIFQDKRETVRGYFILKKAIAAWPQFNYFTAGYAMSALPANSKQFRQGLAWQWKDMDICAGAHIPHDQPDFSKYMQQQTHQGKARACWNSWIAPYNFEGFFLNMGDMLVKNGDWQTAIKIYRNAKLADNYSSWPYRKILEQRIAQAKNNVAAFNALSAFNPAGKSEQERELSLKNQIIMFNSKFSCMACHQSPA